MKQIDACYENYEEANQIIIQGAFNSRRIAEENEFESACFISSDKSRAATTIYGAMKYVAGESFISNVKTISPTLSTIVYGNVINSTGSIIPVIWDHIKNNTCAYLYGKDMTRFIMHVDDAIRLIEYGLDYSSHGCNVLPKCRSARIIDIFELYKEQFNLEYFVTQPRANEKKHEVLASSEETSRMRYDPLKCIFLMSPKHSVISNNETSEYTSKDPLLLLSKEELKDFFQSNNWFK